MWEAASNRLRHLLWLLEVAAFVLCTLLVWATATRSGLNHNEHMYVAAARLFGQLRLYSDYAYLQTPLLPMLNSALFALAGDVHLLLLARVHAALWAVVAVTAVYWLGRDQTRSRAVGVAAALAFASHPLFLVNVAESSNYILPLALALLAFFALLRAVHASRDSRAQTIACGLCGLGIGLAITAKSFYAGVAVGMLAIAWIACGRRPASYALGGLAVGVVPVLYYLVRDPAAFYYGNFGYHVANSDYRSASGSGLPITGSQKLGLVWKLWLDPLWIGASSYCLGAIVVLWRVDHALERRRMFVYVAGLALVGLVAALLPTPAFDKYFIVPAAFLLIAAIAALDTQARWPKLSFIALCALCTATAPATYRIAKQLGGQPMWTRVEREANKLDERLACSPSTYVATLSPILPLEAGCSIYPELATGPFAFRVADHHSHDDQAELNVVGSLRLEAFLDQRKPRAILVGFEPNHDSRFENYAQQHGYVRLNDRFLNRGRLWVAADPVP